MSKGWRIAIVVLLAVAVVGAVSLKALKARDAGRRAEDRAVQTSKATPDTGPSVEPKSAQPAKTEPSAAGKPADESKADSAAPTKSPAGLQKVTKPADEVKPARKPKALPRLVDLGATKCIPCKMMAPILEELAKEYKGRLVVEFIDVWENPEAGKEYGITSIPTQIFYDENGEEFFRHVGFYPKEDILAQFRERGINLSD